MRAELGHFMRFKLVDNAQTNNFDFLRLLFAVFVVFSHSYALLLQPEPGAKFTGGVLSSHGVRGFFFISGLLIASSWKRDPRVLIFLWKRALRIYPGLIVAILFSALLLGPLVTTLSTADYFRHDGVLDYIKHNIGLCYIRYNLPGVFEANPHKYAVNGSIWTLPYELLMYFVVLILGVTRLLRTVRPAIFTLIFLILFELLASERSFFKNTVFLGIMVSQLVPLSIVFVLGVCSSFIFRRIPLSSAMVIIIPIISMFMHVPSLVQYFLLSYWILCAGCGLSWRPLGIAAKADISYGLYIYSFPVQQTLIYGLNSEIAPWQLFCLSMLFSVIFAILSWRYVEKPVLTLKRGMRASGAMMPEATS
jgi:peptidoglycan/LPS O-acetylase OafA/YrhL